MKFDFHDFSPTVCLCMAERWDSVDGVANCYRLDSQI
jgi:hypothetical protein